jgi:hypothetical protein
MAAPPDRRATRVDYTPEPIPTSGLQLSPEIRELIEQLARNTHDIWARQRLADGWKYGPRHDDAAKEHPGLVPYEQLPESEKKYDRDTAGETIKALLALGYRVEPANAPGSRPPGRPSAATPAGLASTKPAGPPPAPRPVSGAAPGPQDIFLPFDPAALGGAADSRPNSQRQAQHEAIRRRVELFNLDAAELRQRHPDQIVRSKRDLLSEAEEASLPPAARAVLERYAVADQLAIRCRVKTRHAFRDLFVAAFLAMTAFEIAAHTFPGDAGRLVRPCVLLLYLVLWGLAAVRWQVAWAGDYQNRHLDYRALAEGLRVQLFWRLLGIPDPVEDHYLVQQRDELEWIRYALRTWRLFDDERLPAAGPGGGDDLDLVRRRWVRHQLDFFTDEAPTEKGRGRVCRQDGKAFFAANIAAVFGLLSLLTATALGITPEEEAGRVAFASTEAVLFILASLALVVAALRIGYAEKMAFAEHANRFEAVRQRFADAEERLDSDEPLKLYRALGQEALSENGNWLLIHRERPLAVPIP